MGLGMSDYLSVTLEGGGSEGQPDGGGNLCLHSSEKWGGGHARGDQGFLQREGGSLNAPPNDGAWFFSPFSLPATQPTVPFSNPMTFTQPHALSPSGLQISHFKIPRYIVFVTNYPLTVTGKVCKVKKMREGQGSLGPKCRRPGSPAPAPAPAPASLSNR